MTLRLPEAVTLPAILLLLLLSLIVTVSALGSASTLAIIPSSSLVCAIPAGESPRGIQCTTLNNSSSSFLISPNLSSFDSISGGTHSLCGLKSGGSSFFCWRSDNLSKKRVYSGPDTLSGLTVGGDQIAAIDSNRTLIRWWRAGRSFPVTAPGNYRSLTSGSNFTCAIENDNNTVRCWGNTDAELIQTDFKNHSMSFISAGGAHACGLDTSGFLLCGGSNGSGQAHAPLAPAYEFSYLALGGAHTCAIRRTNKTVLCWGGDGNGNFNPAGDTQFELIVAGGNLTCGVTTLNFTVVCWLADRSNPSVKTLPLPRILPGVCADQKESNCGCGVFPDSSSLCSGSGIICNSCPLSSSSSPPINSSSPPKKKKNRKWWLAFAIVGAVGAFAGICTVIYCLWFVICRRKKVHNSVQPTIADPVSSSPLHRSPFTSPPGSKSRIFQRQSSRMMRRQRSGPSSIKDRTELYSFAFAELATATNGFAPENKIGWGSFGTVYKGKLADGREVAIKRSDSELKARKLQEKENAFQSELAFLSRLHHKHLVGLVGFCDEKAERLLVYDYMKNGALYDHLHSNDVARDSVVLTSWKMRIKVLLDAARGIEYLHTYAVPPIIHRDIKSSNILLDENWVARVSDFGLSLMGPEGKGEHLTMRVAGTLGYMDPEYYGLRHLTVKSDVYGLGVVMLEVLTGKRAIFRNKDPEEEGGGNPVSVVDFAVPSIVSGQTGKVLDTRAGPLASNEAEAVELVAYMAVHCVSLEGKERPGMTDIVSNLESALAMFGDSHGSISSASISFGSFD